MTKGSRGRLPVMQTRYVTEVSCASESRSMPFTEHNTFGGKSTGITAHPSRTVEALRTSRPSTTLPQRLCPPWRHVTRSCTTPFSHTTQAR